MSPLIFALFLGHAAAPVAQHNYFVIVGNNESIDRSAAPLRFADDDAAKFHEFFSLFAHRIALFSVLDAQSQQIFPDAAKIAKAPKVADLLKELKDVFAAVAADNAAGVRTAFYFVYSGHGQVGKGNEGYLNFLDGRFTRSDLFREVLAKSPASVNHLIIDACHGYLMVGRKGEWKDDRVAADLGSALSALLSTEEISKYPNTGVTVSTTAGAESHEWDRFGGGIFSHEVRSGLAGTADVDGDGKITYEELSAYLEAANREVKDPRAKIFVLSRPPSLNRAEPLLDVKAGKGEAFMRFEKSDSGRFWLEDARGVRYADFNKSPEQPMEIALVKSPHYFLRSEGAEARFEPGKKITAFSTMPAELWDAAVELASANGICPIARALRLDYAALKSRVVQERRGKRDCGAAFIELDGATLAGPSAATVLELSDASGAKLTIRLCGQTKLDVMGLASAFWRRGE